MHRCFAQEFASPVKASGMQLPHGTFWGVMGCGACRNCKFYSLIRPFDKDDLRMLAKVAGFFSNQAHQRTAPFELTPGQWQAFGNWFMSYLRLFRCHQQLWMMRSPTAICGFGVDRARAETLLAHQPPVSTPAFFATCTS